MNVTNWIIAGYAAVFCVGWTIFYFRAAYAVYSIPLFEDECPSPPKSWPSLSIVIAACNEENTLEQAVKTLCQQDYPNLEIIIVNDRSNDRTGEIIGDISRRDDRVKVAHVGRLPARWLGKVNALHVGTEKSRGDWVLYTDADVHFRAGSLRKAMALAVASKTDHLALMPVPHTPSFWLEVIMQAFGMMFLIGSKAADVGKTGSRAFVGIGAFNLVKKSAFNKTEGWSRLRMEVADDMGLGWLLHRSGATSRLMVTAQDVSLTWYTSVKEMFKGLEKNLFGAIAHYRFMRMVGFLLLLWAITLAPAVAIWGSNVPNLWMLGVAALLFFAVNVLMAKIKFRQRLLPMLFAPVGQIVIFFMLLRSAILCHLQGGIIWRGTHYPTEDLRAGQCVKL